MASRLLTDLDPSAQAKAEALLHHAAELNVDILIYCTKRELEEQARLFRNGRSLREIKEKADELSSVFGRPDLAEILIGVGPQMGKHIVTYAGPGQSLHNYCHALDGVPLRDGKPVWGTRISDDMVLWRIYGDAGKRAGFEWAGDWKRGREFPHMQSPDVNWRDLIRGGSHV